MRKQKTIKRACAMMMATAVGITALPLPQSVWAAPGDVLNIGRPKFKNAELLDEVYNHGVDYTTQNMLDAIYQKDTSDGGDSYYMDRILQREGVASGDAGRNGNDDGNTFMTRGRALYMYTSDPKIIGFGGNTAYHQPMGVGNMYEINFDTNTKSEDTSARVNSPSHWYSEYSLGGGITAQVDKFISYQNVAVTTVNLISAGEAAELDVSVTSPFVKEASVVTVGGVEQGEVVGSLSSPANLTELTPRMTADGFAADGAQLKKTISVPAGGSTQFKVVMSFTTDEIPESVTDYERFAEYDNQEALSAQKSEYNKWWGDNIPYIDVPNKAVQKAIDYRWWSERFNTLDANIPGYDYQYPVTVEGCLGYNNAIILTQPMHLQDVKWMRNAYLPYGMLLSAGNSSQSSAFLDNPGNRSNWNNHYGQYLATAGAEAFNVIGGDTKLAETLAYYFEHDAKGQLDHYGNHSNDYLIDYQSVYMTGNDADTISMHVPGIGKWKSHGENAYVYGAADAASKMYALAGNTEKSEELKELAGNIQKDILDILWCSKCNKFETRAVQPGKDFTSHNENQPNLVELSESNNYNYFSEGVVPTDAASIAKYKKAFEAFTDGEQFPIFPYYTANQKHNKMAQEVFGFQGSNNFSNINFTVQARAYEAALRTYDKEQEYITDEMLACMAEWMAWNIYPDEGDVRYPNNNEFYNIDGKDNSNYYRSWIYHNILGNYNYIFIEDMAGMQARADDKIELSPIDFSYDYFMVNNLKYHGKDVTIVWDKNGGHYGNGIPKGYSLYVDNQLAFTLSEPTHVVYDTKAGTLDFPDGQGDITVSNTKSISIPEAIHVGITDENVQKMMDKSGLTGMENVAKGASVTPTYTPAAARAASWAEKHRADGTDPTSKAVNEMKPDAQAVTDGMTVNMPFWGNDGSTTATDSILLNLGAQKTFDMMNIYFYNDRQSGGYAEPGKYTVEYWDGTDWKHMENQTRVPLSPKANHNENLFQEVTTDKVRVTVTNQPGHYTAITEVQLYQEGGTREEKKNQAPEVTIKQDLTKNESLTAYLKASCVDDGMPYDKEVTYQWEVTNKPENARANIVNPNALDAKLIVSEEGSYTVQFTANDGELETTKTLELQLTAQEEQGEVDAALTAQASSDYTAGWENVSGVNNENFNPKKSNQGNGQGWGNWGCEGGAGSTHWISYTWTEPVNIYKNDIYWYDDGGGTRVPSSIKMQYKDEAGEWKDVVMLTDFENAKALNQYNTIEMEPIITKELRINMTLSAAGTGIYRWKVYKTPVNEIAALYAGTKKGVIPQLPTEVLAKNKDGVFVNTLVTWDEITDDMVANDGSFTVNGLDTTTGKFTSAEITVRSDMDTAGITTVEPIEVTAYQGEIPKILPKTAMVGYNNGVKDNVTNKAIWNEITEEMVAEAGTREYADFVQVEHASAKAALKLNVIEKQQEEPEVDRSELSNEITKTEGLGLKEADFTAESWQVLKSALDAAKDIFDKPDATQEEVNYAAKSLQDAVKALKRTAQAKTILSYGFDKQEDITKIADDSDNHFDVTAEGLTEDSFAEGKKGEALKFTQDGPVFDINAGAALASSDITISYWIKRTGELEGDNNILWAKKKSFYNGNGFYLNYPVNDAYSNFFVVDGFNGFYVAENPNQFLPENEWTHVAVTWDGLTKQGKIYKNGVSQVIAIEGEPQSITGEAEAINRFAGNGYNSAEGHPAGIQLDDFQILNQPLSEAQIKELYDSYNSSGEQTDKTQLEQAIQDAKRDIVPKKEAYTPVSYAAFEGALLAAEEVFADKNADSEAVLNAINNLAEAIAGLELTTKPVNKEKLSAVVEQAEELAANKEIYTPVTYAVFEVIWDYAQTVLASETVSQTDVDRAAQTLQRAIDSLETAAEEADFVQLQKDIEAAKAQISAQENSYTPDTYQIYKDALTAAEEVLANGAASHEEVAAAANGLASAIAQLQTKPVPVDKTVLKTSIDQAEKSISANKEKYTDDSYQVYEAALKEAKAVLDDVNAKSDDVNAAMNKLAGSIVQLKMKPVTVDTAMLKSTIEQADKTITVKKDEYTKETYAVYEKALAQAKEVLEKTNPGQEEVTQAICDIASAIMQLERRSMEQEAAGSWIQNDTGWWYQNQDGSYPSSGWQLINDMWYAFDETGYMKTGWYTENDRWFYLQESGAMASNSWVLVDGVWYFVKDNGVMAANEWVNTNGVWYFAGDNGAMASNEWILHNSAWYYLRESGAMAASEWVNTNNVWYYTRENGAMAANEWILSGGTWYYMKGNGAMATSEWIGNYYLDATGAWTRTR